MAVPAPLAALGTRSPRPYPPSWIDRLIAWLEGLPLPIWTSLGIAAGISVIGANVLWWIEGGQPGTLDAFTIFGLVPVYAVALIRHLDRVALDALTRFRPLLNLDAAAYEDRRYRLTTLPRRPALVFALWFVVVGVIGAVANPATQGLVGVAAAPAVVHVGLEGVFNALLAALILKIARYLRDVDLIHRQTSRIDLLDPRPLYAFSRLTAQAALGMLFLIAALVTATGTLILSVGGTFQVALGAFYLALVIGAIGSFILPLYGMHRRISAEKDRLHSASSARLTAVLGELDRDVTGLSLERADGLNKLLASVLSERELIAKLPTWPWQAATFRGFISALLLPVIVYLLARAAERVVL